MSNNSKKTIWIIITIIVVLGVTTYFTLPSLLKEVNGESNLKGESNNIYEEDVDDLDIYDEQDIKTGELESKGYIYNEKYGYIQDNSLIAMLDKINESTLKFISITSLHNFDKGNYNITDVNKTTLYVNILNAFIDEKDYKVLNDPDNKYFVEQSYVGKEKFEKIFTEVTGVENVQEFFNDYVVESTEIPDGKADIIYKKDGKVFYLVPWGYGLEGTLVAYTKVVVNGDKITIEIKKYNMDEKEQYNYACTYTYEISNESLRIYGWNIK